VRAAPVSRYAFANFVAGPGTEPALTAAMAAARTPGENGRLLVISGGVGLGKTHLARAIVNEARAARRGLRAAYCTAEELVRHALDPDGRRRPLDLLVVDDLHCLSARPGAASSRLLGRFGAPCRQIVVSRVDAPGEVEASCVPPDETRVVKLPPPDLDTRVRMLARWAERDRVDLPPDVARFVAERFDRNVRELEGALLRLGAHAFFRREEITLEFAAEILRPIMGPGARRRRRSAMPEPLPAVPRRGDPDDLLAGVRELVEFIHDVGGGRIGEPDVRGQDIFVPLVARDDERYLLHMRVRAYLAEPVRCAFVDDEHRSTRAAWPYPADAGPFRSPSFICMVPTAEFYAWHSERVYRRGEGTLVNTVAAVFYALQAPEYAGRFVRRAR
jgi:DnaA protein